VFGVWDRAKQVWSVVYIVQTVSWAQPGSSPRRQGDQDVKLTTYLKLVQRTRKYRSIHPLPRAPVRHTSQLVIEENLSLLYLHIKILSNSLDQRSISVTQLREVFLDMGIPITMHYRSLYSTFIFLTLQVPVQHSIWAKVHCYHRLCCSELYLEKYTELSVSSRSFAGSLFL
jgi:hypothetical protein